MAAQVVPKRSDAMTAGSPANDMPAPAHLIVTEIFDTDLLGEGILPRWCKTRDAAEQIARELSHS